MPANAVKSQIILFDSGGEQHFRTKEKQKSLRKNLAKEASFGNPKCNLFSKEKLFEHPKEKLRRELVGNKTQKLARIRKNPIQTERIPSKKQNKRCTIKKQPNLLPAFCNRNRQANFSNAKGKRRSFGKKPGICSRVETRFEQTHCSKKKGKQIPRQLKVPTPDKILKLHFSII